MAIRTVLRMGHPILRQTAQPLSAEEIQTKAVRELIQDLIDTMHDQGGIGIAAPQIGVSQQLAVIEIPATDPRADGAADKGLQILINPKLTVVDPTLQGYWEGCLSVPGLRGYVHRPRKIHLAYLDQHGQNQELIAEGFLSTVYQHELDHLWGRLYVDSIRDLRLFSYQEELHHFTQFSDATAGLD